MSTPMKRTDELILARVVEISNDLDDDCMLQCGVSCADGGYGLVMDAVTAILDVHKPVGLADAWDAHRLPTGTRMCSAPECRARMGGSPYPCDTVMVVAKALNIEPGQWG